MALDFWRFYFRGSESTSSSALELTTSRGLEVTGAILERDWKLVRNGQVSANQTQLPDDEVWELFDLANDPAERENLYTKRPKVATRLKKLLEEYGRKAVEPNIPPKWLLGVIVGRRHRQPASTLSMRLNIKRNRSDENCSLCLIR